MKVVAKNTAYLTVAHLVGYVIPLLEIPILARVLGPTTYGQLVLIQSIAVLMSVVVEYGFNLSSAREVAQAIDNKEKLGEIFSDVLTAKLILSACMAMFFIIYISMGLNSSNSFNFNQIIWGILYFLAFAFSPFWFFTGREKVGAVIIFELFLRSICLFLLYILVSGPADADLALALMAITSFANTFITNGLCLRYFPRIRLRFAGGIDAIRLGFNVFVYRSSNTILITAAPALIGTFSDRAAVGIFIPAEKLIRGVIGLSTPFFTAVFPHFSRVLTKADAKDYKVAWTVVVLSVIIGIICAIFLYYFGPHFILQVIGQEFIKTADLLKWFVWLIPLRIINQAISLFSLLIGSILLHEFAALGMVMALLISEFGLAFVLLLLALKKY
jgi:PST family polysaccharide transporter